MKMMLLQTEVTGRLMKNPSFTGRSREWQTQEKDNGEPEWNYM